MVSWTELKVIYKVIVGRNNELKYFGEVVLSSPGCRLELLQVLRTKAVMAWQVYQSPGAALNTGETGDSCKPAHHSRMM